MPKSKRASRRRPCDAPQLYEPRVEPALHVLSNALVGCQMLVCFMSAQQGPDWHESGNLLDAAEADFAKARAWLHKRHKNGGRHARLDLECFDRSRHRGDGRIREGRRGRTVEEKERQEVNPIGRGPGVINAPGSMRFSFAINFKVQIGVV